MDPIAKVKSTSTGEVEGVDAAAVSLGSRVVSVSTALVGLNKAWHSNQCKKIWEPNGGETCSKKQSLNVLIRVFFVNALTI